METTTHTRVPRPLIEREERMMGTTVSVHLASEPSSAPEAELAADACLAWLRDVDAHLSRFKPESELCQLNRAAGRWYSASPLLYAAVEEALRAARRSDGLFDPTLLPQLERIGYDRDFPLIAHQEIAPDDAHGLPPAVAGGGWRGIEMDSARQRIWMPAGVRLDLGGIAKGWAADIALVRYCAAFPGALVNVGGDLRAHGGPQPGEGWSIGIQGPGAPASAGNERQVAVITMSRGGLATSGALRRWWYQRGARRHHVLDPRTGLPAPLWVDAEDTSDGRSPLATATALAPTAAQAEVAAKVALLRGHPQALAEVEANWRGAPSPTAGSGGDHPVALLLTFGTGEVRLSANMPEYLATWGSEGAPVPYRVSLPSGDLSRHLCAEGGNP